MTTSDTHTPELGAVEVHGMTRSSFLLKGALATGAAYGASAVAPFVSSALAATSSSDLDILNFALTLEYLETDFYRSKGKSVGLSGQAKTLATSFGDEEAEHVAALTKAIKAGGGKPVKKPTFAFPVHQPGRLPEARLHAGERRRRRLQRRRPLAQEQGAAGRGGLDRPDRGPTRRVDRGPDRREDHAQRRVRQAPDHEAGPGQGRTADQGLADGERRALGSSRGRERSCGSGLGGQDGLAPRAGADGVRVRKVVEIGVRLGDPDGGFAVLEVRRLDHAEEAVHLGSPRPPWVTASPSACRWLRAPAPPASRCRRRDVVSCRRQLEEPDVVRRVGDRHADRDSRPGVDGLRCGRRETVSVTGASWL